MDWVEVVDEVNSRHLPYQRCIILRGIVLGPTLSSLSSTICLFLYINNFPHLRLKILAKTTQKRNKKSRTNSKWGIVYGINPHLCNGRGTTGLHWRLMRGVRRHWKWRKRAFSEVVVEVGIITNNLGFVNKIYFQSDSDWLWFWFVV